VSTGVQQLAAIEELQRTMTQLSSERERSLRELQERDTVIIQLRGQLEVLSADKLTTEQRLLAEMIHNRHQTLGEVSLFIRGWALS